MGTELVTCHQNGDFWIIVITVLSVPSAGFESVVFNKHHSFSEGHQPARSLRIIFDLEPHDDYKTV